MLEDDSHIAPELRAGYRLLKTPAVFLLSLSSAEAVELIDLLKGIRRDDPRHTELSRRLALVELKLRQAGLSTEFLHGEYSERLMQKINEE